MEDIDDLCNILIKNIGKFVLSSFMKNGNYHGVYSSYYINDIQPTINCKKFPKFRDNSNLEIDNYNHKVLYSSEHIKDNWQYDPDEYHGMRGRAYVNFTFIICLIDIDNNEFYLYVKYNFITRCGSCDGNTSYRKKRLIYSDNLKDLLNFIYTKKQQNNIIKKLKLKF